MPNKEIVIIVRGETKALQTALEESKQKFAQLDSSTHNAERQLQSFGNRARATAELIGMMGAESSEAILKVRGLGSAFKELEEASGGLRGAVMTTIGSFALFAGLDFMRSSVEEAMDGEAAWNKLTAAYKDNAAGLADVKGQIEDGQAAWEKYGMTQATVAALAVRAKTAGIDPTQILGDPSRLADAAAVLGKSIPDAFDILATKGQRGLTIIAKNLGLSAIQTKVLLAATKDLSSAQRVAYIENLVETHGGAGLGAAQAGTATGAFKAFNAAVSDLKEQLGTALLPALTQLATALTTILQGAEKMTKPFGGLGNVFKVLLIPLLVLGLKMFLNLRGVLTTMVDLLLGRGVGAWTQTATSMAAADDEAVKLAADIDAIPAEKTTTAIFRPDTAIKEAWIANIGRIPVERTTLALFEDAQALKDMAALRAEEDAIPREIPVAVEAIAANALAADEEALREQAHAVSIPVVAEALSAAAAEGEMAADRAALEKERGSVGIPVVAEALSSTTAASEMEADRAILEKERGSVGIPVIAEAISSTTAAREMEADRAILEKERGSVGIPVIAENLAGNKAEREKAKKEMLADRRELQSVGGGVTVPVVAENLVGSKAEREKAKREIATDVRELRSVAGSGVIIPIRAQELTEAQATREIAEDHKVLQKAAGAEGVDIPVTGLGANIPVKAGLIDDAQAKRDIATDATLLQGEASKKHVTIPVTGVAEGGVGVEPVLAGDAAAREQSIRNRIMNGIGAVGAATERPIGVPIEVTGGIETAVEKDIAHAQAYATAHPIRELFQGVGANVAFTGGFTVADAVFNGVTIKKANVHVDVPQATFTAADQARLDALRGKLAQATVNVHVASIAPGAINEGVGTMFTYDPNVVKLKDAIKRLEDQKSAAKEYAKALADATKKAPLTVKVAFDWGQALAMLGEVAVGTLIGNVIAKLINPQKILELFKGGTGKLIELVKQFFKGGPPTKPGGGGKVLPFSSIIDKKAWEGVPGGASNTPSVTAIVNGSITGLFMALGSAIITIGIPTLIPIFVGAATVVGGWFAGALETVMTAGAGILSAIPTVLATSLAGIGIAGTAITAALTLMPATASAETVKEAKKAKKSITQAQSGINAASIGTNIKNTLGGVFGKVAGAIGGIVMGLINAIKTGVLKAASFIYTIGSDIINGVKTGVQRGLIGIENLFIGMVNAIIQKIKNAPAIGGLFGNLKPIPPIPVPKSIASGKGAAGLSRIDPSLVSQIRTIINTNPTTPTAVNNTTHSPSYSIHANFTINEATDADKIAKIIRHDLTELVSGVKTARRLHG